MIHLLPEVLTQKVILYLLPEEGLALARVNRTVRGVVRPLQKTPRKQNDGIHVGTTVLYRDFSIATVEPGTWPQWASKIGIVTDIKKMAPTQ